MNKKLLAVAVAGAFAAPVAMADTSNVTLYGVASFSIDSVDGGGGCTPTTVADNCERRTRVSSNTSILGFKGTEDLGNGLSAIWLYETTVAGDVGGSSKTGRVTGASVVGDNNAVFFGGREAYAGLSSKQWGTIQLGVLDTPLKKSTGALDEFGGGYTIADYRSLMGGVSNGSVRAENAIQYVSPTFGGFEGKLMTAMLQEGGSNQSPSLWGASGTYKNGPIFATLAYEDLEAVPTTLGNSSTTAFGAGGKSITASAAGSAVFEQKTWRAGFGYNFGVAKVGLAYEKADVDVRAVGTGATLTNLGGTTGLSSVSTDRSAWYLSGSYTLGKTVLKAAVTRANDLEGLDNTGAKQWTLGADYNLSKRTKVYALYTKLSNESNIAYSLGGNATAFDNVFKAGAGVGAAPIAAGTLGEDPRAFSIGMIHSF